MSTGEDVRRRHEKRLNDESQAQHSMTSEQDQLTVDEREQQREAISRARKPSPDSTPNASTRDDRGPGDAGGGA